MEEPYKIKLPIFEGPFDLLLFFVERDELDIYDIPIAKVANDFLEYTHQLEKINLEQASEFMLFAASLMRIKAKMLLPRPSFDEHGNEIDPRAELVSHLLEYKKYKSVLQQFAEWEEENFHKEKRGNLAFELEKLASEKSTEIEMQSLDLFQLLKAYQHVLQRFKEKSEVHQHKVTPYPYTIAGQKDKIKTWLKERKRMSFEDLVMAEPIRIALIYNFLAILEMVQFGELSLAIGLGFNNFWIEHVENPMPQSSSSTELSAE